MSSRAADELIEVRVSELQQLFNAMDASPFRERDLDPDAEEFIASWAREAPRGANLALLVDVDRAPGLTDEPAALRDTIHEFFNHRAQVSRTRLHELLRIGRTSLLVGTVFLAAAVGLGDLVASSMSGLRLGELLREGLVICGWVAMWRPLEIFLYGWWPIRAQARLYDRLGAMPVRIAYNKDADPGSPRLADHSARPHDSAEIEATSRHQHCARARTGRCGGGCHRARTQVEQVLIIARAHHARSETAIARQSPRHERSGMRGPGFHTRHNHECSGARAAGSARARCVA